ncbi:hypothetical protein ACFOEZ_10480 [Tianweitania populi]|uniref:AtuA-like ferredoxin-fold domain-containing protein n=1 Tax=Tianweitania populi TaxID=1607949 RepID=A0A8J3E024_9HYPH|nr:hypothetical protein [Tianweitania populi]GHD20708.1 hypothetical protein GCM10016234_33240 [Tianweitania populi]
MAELSVPLHKIAHARAGDKDNRLNISLFPYDPAHWHMLAKQVTPERIREHFSRRKPTSITRHDLPVLGGFNIVLENALGGGVNSSLYLDAHGKCLSFHLLSMPILLSENCNV